MRVEVQHRLNQGLDRFDVEGIGHRFVIVSGFVMLVEVFDAKVKRGILAWMNE